MDKRQRIRALASDERGGTAVEYGLIAALIVIASITALKNLAETNSEMWNNVSNEVAPDQ